jgi:hypothetical protein
MQLSIFQLTRVRGTLTPTPVDLLELQNPFRLYSHFTIALASNVVVMNNNRRYVVKTTPSMLCREILAQACEKIGFRNIENYGLKLTPP